jgi:hypothetical protein
MQEEIRRLGKLVAGYGAMVLLVFILVYVLNPHWPTRWPTRHAHRNSIQPGDTVSIPTYRDLPVGKAPSWFKQDIDAITKAMNIWVAPAKDPAWGDDFGGCRANRHLTFVVSNFQADLNTRPMPESLSAIQQQLRKAAKEMEDGAHLRDRFCDETDLNTETDTSAAIGVYNGVLLVHKGFSRLRRACLSLTDGQ